MARLDFIVLALVALCCAAMLVPVDGQACTPGVISCSDDCVNVLFCLSDGTSIEVDTCKDGSLCDFNTHECVVGGQCLHPPDHQFLCHALGYFPDPFECTKFHLCLNNDSLPADQTSTCPDGTAYDALTTRCSLAPDSRPCTAGPVPACKSAGQFGPQQENPNIYYVCVRDQASGTLQPALYKCPVNEVFVGTKCVVGKRRLQITQLLGEWGRGAK